MCCNAGSDGSVTLTELADQAAIFTVTTLRRFTTNATLQV
jgi:hypothetical protein